MKLHRPLLFPRRMVLSLASLALVSGARGAQGVIEPRHDIFVEDITYWGCQTQSVGNRTLDVVGDVNGDGYDDVVVSDPNNGPNNCLYADGSVTVLSGLDGSALWAVGGQHDSFGHGWSLGWSVSGAGDWDADGTPDVIAGAPWADGGEGRVLLYSGDDGALLSSLPNPYPEASNNCGYSVSGIEDLNADGHDDVIVGCLGQGAASGGVLILSGANGLILRDLANPSPSAAGAFYFGYAVRDGSDIDGDGVHDVLVGNPIARNAANEHRGAVYVFSGATGALLHEVFGPVTNSRFADMVDGVGDQNGDGRDDYIVASENLTARVISGMDASVLWSGGYSTASGAGDVNGDGIEDFLVGWPGNYYYNGIARVVAGGTFATLYSFIGPANSDARFGSALSRAGDINRDGFADFMVGAGGIDRVYICLGRPVPAQIRRIDGGAAGDRLGHAVSGAGDVDGDGFADVIVGSPYDDTAAGTDAGSARVVSGFDGSEILVCTGAAGDLIGSSVSGAGDVNRDGFADVIVGARHDDTAGTNAGAARVLSGRNGSTLFTFHGSAAEDYFGSVSEAGDVNGDGYADVIVGGPWRDSLGMTDAGAATVYSGRDGSVLLEWFGSAVGDVFGYSVSSAGDVDADGRADLIVGSRGSDVNGTDSGSATIYSGFDGTELFTHHGQAVGDLFGYSVSDAGDVNKDGFADVIVGGARVSGTQTVRVFAGPTGALLYEFTENNLGNYFGASVSGAGDVNGDGYDDMIVGAQWAVVTGGANQAGVARVYSGFDGGVLLYQFPGDEDQAAFGISVSGAGDVNGDGRDDVIVGAYLRDSAGLSDAGRAFVYSLGYPGDAPKRRRPKAPPGPTITFP